MYVCVCVRVFVCRPLSIVLVSVCVGGGGRGGYVGPGGGGGGGKKLQAANVRFQWHPYCVLVDICLGVHKNMNHALFQYHLGVETIMLEEHPRPFHMEVTPLTPRISVELFL